MNAPQAAGIATSAIRASASPSVTASSLAVDGIDLGSAGPVLRPARAERRRQDQHDPHALDAHPPDSGRRRSRVFDIATRSRSRCAPHRRRVPGSGARSHAHCCARICASPACSTICRRAIGRAQPRAAGAIRTSRKRRDQPGGSAFRRDAPGALDIARGVHPSAAILFLDEPTIGLDLPNRRAIWRIIERLRARTGMTVPLTTHYLEEADGCDRVVFIRKGRLVRNRRRRATSWRALGRHMLEVEGADLDALVAGRSSRGSAPPARGRRRALPLRREDLALSRGCKPSLEAKPCAGASAAVQT